MEMTISSFQLWALESSLSEDMAGLLPTLASQLIKARLKFSLYGAPWTSLGPHVLQEAANQKQANKYEHPERSRRCFGSTCKYFVIKKSNIDDRRGCAGCQTGIAGISVFSQFTLRCSSWATALICPLTDNTTRGSEEPRLPQRQVGGDVRALEKRHDGPLKASRASLHGRATKAAQQRCFYSVVLSFQMWSRRQNAAFTSIFND